MGDFRVTRLKTSKLSPTDERRHPLSGGRGKIAVAALVLSVGVAAAVVFRKTPAETSLPPASSDSPLVLREDPPRATPKAAPAPHLVGRIDPLDLRDQTPGADPMREVVPDQRHAHVRSAILPIGPAWLRHAGLRLPNVVPHASLRGNSATARTTCLCTRCDTTLR